MLTQLTTVKARLAIGPADISQDDGNLSTPLYVAPAAANGTSATQSFKSDLAKAVSARLKTA